MPHHANRHMPLSAIPVALLVTCTLLAGCLDADETVSYHVYPITLAPDDPRSHQVVTLGPEQAPDTPQKLRTLLETASTQVADGDTLGTHQEMSRRDQEQIDRFLWDQWQQQGNHSTEARSTAQASGERIIVLYDGHHFATAVSEPTL